MKKSPDKKKAAGEGLVIAKAVGLVARRKREQMEISQEMFSELTGHHRTYIGLFERGERSPNVNTLDRIAKALRTTASELLREAGY